MPRQFLTTKTKMNIHTWTAFLDEEELKARGRCVKGSRVEIRNELTPNGKYIFRIYKEGKNKTLVVQYKGKFKPNIWRFCLFGPSTSHGLSLIPTDEEGLGAIITLTASQIDKTTFIYNEGIFEVPLMDDTFERYLEWVYVDTPEAIFIELLNRIKGLHQLNSFDYGNFFDGEDSPDTGLDIEFSDF
jgi:hypothetical protein